MNIVFLGARLPLTKTFLSNAGTITSTPYPQVSRVTSHHEQATDLVGLHALIQKHSALGHCLFGGQLDHPLSDESRAGKTKKTPKEWVVFDFDKVEAKDAADVVARFLPVECQNVSYIAQLSASMFRPDTTLWSGHIFMLLKTATDEMRVKQWFEAVNFMLPALTGQMCLSDSLQALHWPLDRTVAYNSKLIYIAPPKCHGFVPAVKQPLTLVKKKQPAFDIPPFNPIDSTTIRQKINELRRAIGEDEITYTTGLYEGEEILLNADLCQVSGVRTSGDHYIRFNLNGGDSYAYFVDLRNPGIVRNFKGEPLLKTADVAPDFYKKLRAIAPSAVAQPPLDEAAEILAFYTFNQSSNIRIGTYSPATRRLDLQHATETSARSWQAQHGMVQKENIPHKRLVFNPQSDVQYLSGSNEINTYRATDYMTQTASSVVPSTAGELPPLTNKILRSMLGDPTPAVLNHFLNWLAFIFQTRKKTGTAWLLHGRTGTGKGTFIEYILAPLFGHENVRREQFGAVESQFNAFLEDSLFVIFDEADANAVDNQAALMAKVKHWITEPTIEINQKGVKTYQAQNYTNFFFTTNTKTPAIITRDDRRFNIPERQEVEITYSPNEATLLESGKELEKLADILLRWPVNEAAVRTIIETEARQTVHESTTPINQLVAEAVQRGDLQFFLDRMPSDLEAMSDFRDGQISLLGVFKTLSDQFIKTAGTPRVVTEEELFVLFRVLIPDVRYFQDSKTWRKRHFKALGLDVDKQFRVGVERKRGVMVTWKKPSEVPDFGLTTPANVVGIRGKKS